jgi:hypothetical protein
MEGYVPQSQVPSVGKSLVSLCMYNTGPSIVGCWSHQINGSINHLLTLVILITLPVSAQTPPELHIGD